MTFRKFGGLDYASKHNIVTTYNNISGVKIITNAFGQEDTRIVSKSDIDMYDNEVFNESAGIGTGYVDHIPQHVNYVFTAPEPVVNPYIDNFNDSSNNSYYYSSQEHTLNNSLHITGNLSVDGYVKAGTYQYGNTISVPNEPTTNNTLCNGDDTTYEHDILIDGNLTVTKTMRAGTYMYTSDYRLKTDIQPISSSYTVDNLRPVEYLRKDTGKQEFGFIAHELDTQFPFLVEGKKDASGKMQCVNYIGLIGLLVHEIQLLKKQVSDIKN